MLSICYSLIAYLYTGIMTVMGIGTITVNVLEVIGIKPESFKGMNTSIIEGVLYVLLMLFLLAVIAFSSRVYRFIHTFFLRVMVPFKALIYVMGLGKADGEKSFDELLDTFGYAYDEKQDIFYSEIDPWQRDYGYCRLYDEAMAPLSMIVDCEPIYFEYNKKRWMIEFWKGQYGMTTGCEVGIYTTKDPDLDILGVFKGTFYNCADDKDFLHMSCSLIKNGKTIFTRRELHWWLTGFKLGEFSEPSELVLKIKIVLKDQIMLNAFVKGLMNAGYKEHEITVYGNVVGLVFDKARTAQPVTRTEVIEKFSQMKNKLLCEKYQDITEGYVDMKDKLKAIEEKDPDMYKDILNIGKPKQMFNVFELIKDYLS